MRWRRNLKTAGAVAVVASVGLLTHMSPASAEPGAGVSTGVQELTTDNLSGPLPICAHARDLKITLANTGTFTAQTQVYVGASTATFTAAEGFWFSAHGVFSNELCTTPTTVTGSLTVSGTAGSSTVSCSGTAEYTRQGANGFAITTLVGSNGCQVNGVPALSAILTFAGNQNPCFGEDFPLPLPDPCAAAPEYVGAYTQV